MAHEDRSAYRAEFSGPLPAACSPLWDLVLDAMNTEPRYDMVLEPRASERKPCPACRAPAEKMTYRGMLRVCDADAEGMPGVVRVSVDSRQAGENSPGMRVAFADCRRVTIEPCGHEFDGRTGDPVTEGRGDR